MEVSPELLLGLLSIVFPPIIGAFGFKLHQAKNTVKDVTREKETAVQTMTQERDIVTLKTTTVVTFLTTIMAALEDETITTKEAKKIKTQMEGILGLMK